jgi:hypothetical protein
LLFIRVHVHHIRHTKKKRLKNKGCKMADEIISLEPATLHSDKAAGKPVCPVCGREAADGLVSFVRLSESLQRIVAANAPAGALVSEVCPRCVELFERARVQLEVNAAIFEQGGYVLPTPLRLDADARFTGRGVTIAFRDFTRTTI